ncbi:MAG: hypothetical protein WC824_06015 [Bacteroidota bacterium]|jgi:hypothetical protein
MYQVIERAMNGWKVIVSEKTPEKAKEKKTLADQRPAYKKGDGLSREVMGTKPVGHEYPDSVADAMSGWPRIVTHQK